MFQEPTRTPPGFGAAFAKLRRSSAALAALAWSAAWILVAATPASAAAQRPASTGLYKDRITPHWFHQSTRFWYRNDLRDGAREFIVVDAVRGTREPAFDPARLTAGLAIASGLEVLTDRLPFDRIEFVRDGKAFRFNTAETAWECDLDTYQCTRTDAGPAPEDADNPDARSRARGERGRRAANGAASRDSARSPDGRLEAVIRDHNVYVRTPDSNEPDVPLTKDGRDGLGYGWPSWSPDSSTLIAFRIEPAERKEVFLIESSPRDGGRAVLHRRPYALPGDPFTTYELNLFNVAGRSQIRPEVERFEHEWLRPRPRWIQDGRRLAYEQTDRGHQRFRVIEVDRQTGAVRNLVDETSQTFIWTAHTENLRLDHVNWLEQTEELILVSERDGWRHLYLVDTRDGNVKTQITQGPWVVRGIDRIDEPNRQIWFHAGGRNPDQDPYQLHFYRVGFDGTGLVALTEGDGNHSLQLSPDRRHAIDTYSRVDRPPVHELRRTSDGGLVCRFEEADISELREGGWEPPEVFVAKGRDATTDIWGIICRPRPFDPSRKYPVIEDVYAGPQGSFVPKNFSRTSRYESLLNRGFIVVKVDGMGTANRSKAFHDVCWKNLKDAGFPDRIRWHQAAAAKYPHYDLDRLGIYGNSAGGQNAAAAVLFHPDFYKVAVASCGCHDNRLDKASWNEQWMGYPVGPQYSESSNIDNAHRLRGKLFLIVGELDRNVPPESTLRFADALVRAGKDFELLVIPGGGHGMGGAYGQRRMEDFLVRHLLGQEPPDRNGASTPPLDD